MNSSALVSWALGLLGRGTLLSYVAADTWWRSRRNWGSALQRVSTALARLPRSLSLLEDGSRD
ncbi:hypothetical protein BD626DRAFT_503335 [Schizophyllum amplum]|uniref:Uncharacterized protein n=1 Tax=Schizophyllum amplum TaxID=97359 RepID=A0A550C849_9AGAR|nr:hypothetical protein BD626DRAFT_507256 [Auriculariopsis ampla]TRM60957.1 hypothetical protein BD626DRAFT_503335 [Auriculariopsis ampla]